MRRELPLHDATFDGIITNGRNTTIYLTRSDGVGCSVDLLGVSELKLDDFQLGNIVVEFAITSGEEVSPKVDIRRLLLPPHPSASSEYHSKHDEIVRSRMSSIAKGTLAFVEVIPAIGAELVAICSEVSFKAYGPDNRPIDQP